MTFDEAIQRCENIIESLEKRYAELREKHHYMDSDVTRVQLENYEHVVRVLKRKRIWYNRTNLNYVNFDSTLVLEHKIRYATIDKVNGDTGALELEFLNKDSIIIFVDTVDPGYVGAGLPVLKFRYVQHPDNIRKER